MTREEEIKQAAQAYYPQGTLYEVAKVSGFIRGAKWADKNPTQLEEVDERIVDFTMIGEKNNAKKMCKENNTTIKAEIIKTMDLIINYLQNNKQKIINNEQLVNEDWVRVAAPFNNIMNVLMNHWYLENER